jgi:hypothetical protein
MTLPDPAGLLLDMDDDDEHDGGCSLLVDIYGDR